MIGAMPAVAVRHERRRAEKRGGGGRRPSQLPLQIGRPGEPDPTPSPDRYRLQNELYVCAKVTALYAVVGSLLLGTVLLVVGLVQLSPGAEAAQHRYYLMGTGAILLGSGILGALLRWLCLHCYNRQFYADEEVPPAPSGKNSVCVLDAHAHGHDKHAHAIDKDKHEKPRLKTQASVGRDVDTLIKQPSAASDT